MLSLVVFILPCLVWGQTFSSDKPPQITLGGWSSVEDFRTWITNSTPPLGQISAGYSKTPAYVVPASVVGLSIICNATYPIEWWFHREKWGGRAAWQTSVTTTRGSDLTTLAPIWYSSELRLLGESPEITGNYTCQRYGRSEMSTSTYVYWEGAGSPLLTLARAFRGKKTVYFNSQQSNSFVLPCTVSRPDVPVTLYQLLDEEHNITLPQNDSIKYDNARGYTLQDLPNPAGHYMCVVGDREDNDVIEFQVKIGQDPSVSEFNNMKWKNAAFSYDNDKRQFVCCSASNKPPKMINYYCDHPITCKLRKHALHNMDATAKRVNGSCSTIQLRGMFAGVLRCVGDSIDIVKEYFFPIIDPMIHFDPSRSRNNSIKPYFDWSEADSSVMMSVTNYTEPFYVGQTVKFDCQVSPFYFSQGLHWTVKYSNEKSIIVKGNSTRGRGGRHPFELFLKLNHAYIEITGEETLESVTCHAPVWNSTEFKEKKIQFKIKAPVVPKIIGALNEEQTWLINVTKTTLSCSYSGEPQPYIFWKKNNMSIYKGVKTTRNTSTSVLTFDRVSLESHGVYTCNVTNFAGSVVKTFNLYVSAPASSEVTFLYVFAALCVCGIVAGLFVAVKKFNEQKDAIRKLANVAFKDVTNNGSAEQAHQTPVFPVSENAAVIPTTTGSSNYGFAGEFLNEPSTPDANRYQKM